MIYVFLLAGFVFTLFALHREKYETDHSYKDGVPQEKDNIGKLYHKLKICLAYDSRVIKWRRVFISTCLSMLLFFAIAYQRIPTCREFILFLIVVYGCFFFEWSNYTSVISKSVENNGIKCIDQIKRKNYILS